MTPTIRLLPFAAADGPSNMAADEALLETAAARGTASLRFYTWTEPTLSLGYFQPSSAVGALEGRIAWVRRATGGEAIVHHHELTYALALPPGKEWQPPGANWICRFHHVVRDVLAAAGIGAHAVVCGEERRLGEVLCFLHQTPGDLVLGGSKVAGSAQRKRKGALLQHGSLLLRRSPFAPALPGINDAAGRDAFTPESLADHLTPQLAADTGWEVTPGTWTDDETTRRTALRADRYATQEWNAKR